MILRALFEIDEFNGVEGRENFLDTLELIEAIDGEFTVESVLQNDAGDVVVTLDVEEGEAEAHLVLAEVMMFMLHCNAVAEVFPMGAKQVSYALVDGNLNVISECVAQQGNPEDEYQEEPQLCDCPPGMCLNQEAALLEDDFLEFVFGVVR